MKDAGSLGKVAAVTVALAALVACTNAYLYDERRDDELPVDRAVALEGRFCTVGTNEVLRPIKILVAMDASQSMKVTDPDGTRATALIELIENLPNEPEVYLSVMLFAGSTTAFLTNNGLSGFQQVASPVEAGLDAVGVDPTGSVAWRRLEKTFPGIGQEFMPPLDEGSLLAMPSLLPSASLTEVQDVIARQNRAMLTVPEVKSAVGKYGRAESALDPAPIGMIETIVLLKPEREWRMVEDEDGRRRDDHGGIARETRCFHAKGPQRRGGGPSEERPRVGIGLADQSRPNEHGVLKSIECVRCRGSDSPDRPDRAT